MVNDPDRRASCGERRDETSDRDLTLQVQPDLGEPATMDVDGLMTYLKLREKTVLCAEQPRDIKMTGKGKQRKCRPLSQESAERCFPLEK